MIRTEHLSIRIGQKSLLEDVTLEFSPGQLNLIIGPNGAGKSTLIRALSSQLTPDHGRVLLDGKDLKSLTLQNLAKRRAVLSQHIEIPFPLSVEEVVMMGRYPHFIGKQGPHDVKAVNEAMELFEVSHFADRNYQTLSGGEKQRVNFARVLCQIWYETKEMRYLLLDEPLTFLDVHFQFQFMERLKYLLRTSSLVVVGVVHDLNLAARFGEQITLLKNGKVLAHGGRDTVLSKENIYEAFQLVPHIHRENDQMFLMF